MNPTIWTDKMRVTDPIRQGVNKRGVVLARFGGLGNHRYQHGFSGDVKGLTWSNLAYQPYFSMTASNVLYGFWSHDIEGPRADPEMYVRWLQWGAWSAIMRSHERGMSAGGCNGAQPWHDPRQCSVVRPWNVPAMFFAPIRAVLRKRASLIPYIYSQTRAAFDTGVSIVRPMYYAYPELEQAYAADKEGNFGQYMFGPDMLVSPVAQPVDCSAEHPIATKALRCHSYGLDSHCR